MGTIDRVEVIAEAGDGHEALRLIEELQPDIMFLDLTMRGLDGFEVLDTTTRRFPNVRVIILTIHDEAEYAIEALRAGAAGYLPKTAAISELREAIEIVARGEKYVSEKVSKKALLEYGKGPTQKSKSPGTLTPPHPWISPL